MLIRLFYCRAELGGWFYVADVTAGDKTRHGDARHTRGLHPTSRVQELSPEPSPKWFQAPLLYMWRQSVGKTLWSVQVHIILHLAHV